jgi:HAD superfamily hydrolase (TIGR01490 family)
METISSKDSNNVKGYIAFFDLDQTVINTNSGKVLIQYSYKQGLITIFDIIRGAYISFLYRFDLRDTLKIINSLVGWLKGVPEAALLDLTARMFSDRLLQAIRPEIREEIKYHKINGGKVVLLSSAILPVCRQVADYLEMDDIICSVLEVKDGIYTGFPAGTLCFGKEKVTRLTEYCKNKNINPVNAWYYGDSIDDLPVMSSVGTPVCVCPDKKLLKEASKRGWKVLSRSNPK